MNSTVWLIDEPSPFADRQEWEAHLADLRRSQAAKPHPQLQAAIERAETALRDLIEAPSKDVRKAG
jgi:hypothetical protein